MLILSLICLKAGNHMCSGVLRRTVNFQLRNSDIRIIDCSFEGVDFSTVTVVTGRLFLFLVSARVIPLLLELEQFGHFICI